VRLISIELENFRQYGGRHKVTFAQEPGHNVTLFYGTNGAGKTTLLNAFTWALYGHLSADVEERERLITDQVWQEAPEGETVTGSVVVEFEHDGRTYAVRRTVNAQKLGPEQRLPTPQITMQERGTDGATREVRSPSSQIDRILPQRLSRFFFVNGERIEQLVRRDAYAEIQDAIKTLLGLEQLERAITHLPKARDKLRHQLKSEDAYGDAAQRLTSELDTISQGIDDASARRKELNDEIQHLDDEIELIDQRLRSLEGAQSLQRERDRLEDLKRDADASFRRHEEERAKLLSAQGFLAFLPRLSDEVVAACDALRERGELPAPLKRTFIEDLLAKGVCICGNHLEEGSHARAEIETWRARAGLAEVESAWNQLRGSVGSLGEQRESMLAALKTADTGIEEAEREVRRLTEDINEISGKLKDLPLEEAGKLEIKREELLDARTAATKELGSVEMLLEDLRSRREQKEREIEQLQVKDAANQRVQRRVAALKEVETALTKILNLLSDATRRRLDHKIRELFEGVSLKNFKSELTSSFRLDLWQDVSGQHMPVAKSTGENMLLALSFVAALAAESRTAAEGGLISGVGGEFPVVMDAAFGNLDDDYRRQIADFLPTLTPQVVVLTSRAQATGVVEEQLRKRVGKQYVITAHTAKTDLGNVTEQIGVNGRDYPYQVVGSSKDGAEFTEVES
jgi:DNA sulfur modification protein DndD